MSEATPATGIPCDVFKSYLAPFLVPSTVRKARCCCKEWGKAVEDDILIRRRLVEGREWCGWGATGVPRNIEEILHSEGMMNMIGIQRVGVGVCLRGWDSVFTVEKGKGSTTMLCVVAGCVSVREGNGFSALMLVGSREDAKFAVDLISKLNPLTAVISGSSLPQCDILVGTPKRAAHCLTKSSIITTLKVIAVDANLMNEGFGPDILSIIALYPDVQLVVVSYSPPDPLITALCKNPFIYSEIPLVNFFSNHEFLYTLAGDKEAAIVKLLNEATQPSIIFVNHFKKAENLTIRLLQEGQLVCMVHEEMSREDREQSISIFMRSSVSVLCITYNCLQSTFDASKARMVVHADYEDPASYLYYLATPDTGSHPLQCTSAYILSTPSEVRSLETAFRCTLRYVDL